MLIKGIVDEDFINYKLPSMFIATATCSFKCDKEVGRPICQNSALVKQPDIDISDDAIIERYSNNPITHAVVFGGLEPFEQFTQLLALIKKFRDASITDDIVIYTGWNKSELENAKWDAYLVESDGSEQYWNSKQLNCIRALQYFPDIVIKYGRFIPDQQPHFDPVLGVNLASDNQYAERIS